MTDLVVGDVSVVHPGGAACVGRASREGGSAAETRARQKTLQHSEPGKRFVPLVSESYGRLYGEADAFLHELAAVACQGDVTPAAVLGPARLRPLLCLAVWAYADQCRML
jgi:hypothetical protein